MTDGPFAVDVERVLDRTYFVFPSSILRLTCGDASGRGYGVWLREPDRDG